MWVVFYGLVSCAGRVDDSFWFALSDDEFSSSGVSCSGGGIKGARQPQHPLRTGAGSSANPVVTASGNLNHHQQRPPSSSGSRPQGALGALGALGANGREKRPLGQDNKNCPPAKKIQADPPPDMFPDDDDDILLMADMPIEADSTTFEPFEPVAVSRAISTTSLTVSSTVRLGSPGPVRPFVYLAPCVNMRPYPAGQSVCVKVIGIFFFFCISFSLLLICWSANY